MADAPFDPREFAAVRALRVAGWRGVLLGLNQRGPALGAFFLLLVVPALYLSGEMSMVTVNQLGRYCTYALVAIGLDLVWGYAGILSLCQAAFFTMGGYVTAMHLVMHGPKAANGVPQSLAQVSSEVGGPALPWFWVPFDSGEFTTVAVLVIPAVIAGIFGWMAFRSRIKGVYFSIITQAFTVALYLMFGQNLMMLGGTNGLNNFTSIAGLPVGSNDTRLILYLISVLALIGATTLALWLTRTRFGRILLAVRDSEARLRFAGYQPALFKAAIFAFAGLLGALGGALYVPQTGIITPKDMDALASIMVVVWVAVGGRGTIIGAVIGALAINLLYGWLTTYVPELWPFVMGALFVSVVLFIPDGVVGQWRRWMALVGQGLPVKKLALPASRLAEPTEKSVAPGASQP